MTIKAQQEHAKISQLVWPVLVAGALLAPGAFAADSLPQDASPATDCQRWQQEMDLRIKMQSMKSVSKTAPAYLAWLQQQIEACKRRQSGIVDAPKKRNDGRWEPPPSRYRPDPIDWSHLRKNPPRLPAASGAKDGRNKDKAGNPSRPSAPAQHLYRCTAPDGSHTYTDKPCPGEGQRIKRLGPDPSLSPDCQRWQEELDLRTRLLSIKGLSPTAPAYMAWLQEQVDACKRKQRGDVDENRSVDENEKVDAPEKGSVPWKKHPTGGYHHSPIDRSHLDKNPPRPVETDAESVPWKKYPTGGRIPSPFDWSHLKKNPPRPVTPD